MKFQIEMAKKEAELLERYGSEAGSRRGLEAKSGSPSWPQMTGKENVDRWSADLDAKPLNPDAADFVPAQNSPAAATACPGSTAAKVNIVEMRTVNESSTRDVDDTAIFFNSQCCKQCNQ